jgi:hypothetical protein
VASRERADTFRHVGHVGLPANIDVEVDDGGNVGLFMLSAGFGVELSPWRRDELRELLDRAAMPGVT